MLRSRFVPARFFVPVVSSAPFLLLAALGLPDVLPAQGSCSQAIGAMIDRGSTTPARAPWVHVFDPATRQITGTVELPTASVTGVFDIEISPDLREAYVSDNNLNQVWFIDLTTTPPSLVPGASPLQLTGGCLDLSLTPNGRWLLVASGNGLATGGTKMIVVDVLNRVQAFERGFHPTSATAVEVAADGSVLVADLQVSQASYAETNVRRFRIAANGSLVDTGEVVGIAQVPGVQDLLAPSYPHLPPLVNRFLSRHVVHVSRPAGQTLGTLRVQGLAPVDSKTLAYPTGIDLVFDPLRSLVYARTIESPASGPAGLGNSRIDAYLFNPFNGQLNGPLVTIGLERRPGTAFGCEQMAIDPLARRLFVAGLAGGEVRVFDSLTGAQVDTITSPDLIWPLGIAVRRN
jgi:hypothetical protein